MANRSRSSDAQSLATNILSVATFQHSDNAARAGLHSLMCALDDEATLDKVQRFNLQALATSIWGVSVIGGFSLKFYRQLWERCAEVEFSESHLDKSSFRMMYQGCLLMTAVAPNIAKSMPAPIWLHTEAKRLWQEQAKDATTSSFQRVFSQHLSEMGVPHELELQTPDEMLALDIGLSEHRIAFECDGPSHFCVNAGVGSVPLSRNNARDALLGARGWHVIRVPWDDWASHVDREGCKEWITRSSGKFGIGTW